MPSAMARPVWGGRAKPIMRTIGEMVNGYRADLKNGALPRSDVTDLATGGLISGILIG